MPPTEDTVPSTRGRSVSALTLESQQRGSRMLIFDKGCAIPSIYKFFYPESTGRSNVKTKTLDTLHTIISCKNFHHPQTKQCEIWNVEFIPQNPS
jgi:hypothetical protein